MDLSPLYAIQAGRCFFYHEEDMVHVEGVQREVMEKHGAWVTTPTPQVLQEV